MGKGGQGASEFAGVPGDAALGLVAMARGAADGPAGEGQRRRRLNLLRRSRLNKCGGQRLGGPLTVNRPRGEDFATAMARFARHLEQAHLGVATMGEFMIPTTGLTMTTGLAGGAGIR